MSKKINSRNKGAVGEREFAKYLTQRFGINARRGQQFSGGTDSPDVVHDLDGVHFEVKRVERLNIHDAIEQARRDSGANVGVVAHRKNGKPWLLTVEAENIERLIMLWTSYLKNQVETTES